ncbi:MAG: DUF6270 domain-containing protein [Clostridium sp.]|uniref:DUF6270 domain-containing protein n=1 Tax=Clostridium sp. TaxID=1506 RepID=UPI0025C286A4|nr:DUF6270 domain-containing protein [Clostridium sp.]MCE5219850.1 DUF6270 domain-containing protein [Clostridium sp.]
MELNESIFDVDVGTFRNNLKCKIVLRDIVSDNFQYAFYLIYDKERIDTKYYTKNNTAEFHLTDDGEYSVVGFVKYEEEVAIKKSQSINFKFNSDYPVESEGFEKNPIPISIFGSCVSRDLLEFDRRKKFNLRTYVARQSIVSAVSPPIKCNVEDINLQSKFQREMVYNDLAKETFERFKGDGSKYLMIDLIDERYKILKYNQLGAESVITYSASLQESGYLKELDIIPRKKKRKIFGGKSYYVYNKKLDWYLKEFCDRILNIYKSQNIIIHKCKMVDYYINSLGTISKFDINNLSNNKKVNDLLDYMYDYLEANIPNSMVIDICDSFCADENHKWGLAPMHYEQEYYVKAFAEIQKMLVGRK